MLDNQMPMSVRVGDTHSRVRVPDGHGGAVDVCERCLGEVGQLSAAVLFPCEKLRRGEFFEDLRWHERALWGGLGGGASLPPLRR
jgi:hypothetical protein